MKSLHRMFISIFIIVFILLFSLIYMNTHGYKIFIAGEENYHSLVVDGTLVIFKDIPLEDVEIYDIITLSTSSDSIARVMSINNQKKTFEIVYDDFDSETITISQKSYSGKLLFHANEIGKLYDDYLKQYSHYFVIVPFLLLITSFICRTVHILLINRENSDFEYCYILDEKNMESPFYITYSSLDNTDIQSYFSLESHSIPQIFMLPHPIVK